MPRKIFPRLGRGKILSELVHQELRDDILHGRIKPGKFLSTGQIAKAMGVSPMPVRAAVTRLQTEGLVVIVP
jgi:DNA-binding GntR family transcriptional regulator